MIDKFFTHTIIRTRFVKNSLGSVTSESERTYRCRIEPTTVRTSGADGEYRTRQYRIYASKSADIQVNDRITFFSTGLIGSGESYVVRSVFRASGFGLSHLEVYV